jgi:phosphoribosyl-ATP pyrophosphohydrolase
MEGVHKRRHNAYKRNKVETDVALETPFTLTELAVIVKERATASADASYTRKLLDRGVGHCAKKLGEEAVEMALASVTEDRERVIGEAADLLFHFLVVLQARGIDLAEVEAVLKKRSGQSGLAEKASRVPDQRPSDL